MPLHELPKSIRRSTDLAAAKGAPVRARVRLFRAVVRPLQAFLQTEASSGVLLLGAAIAALFWANVDARSYERVFEYPLEFGVGMAHTSFSFRELVNDGLMTIFFFVVGMEIKRELVTGELNTLPKALLPAIAALGGMILPATIFYLFNSSGAGRSGWGIPMATDIAFSVGILTLLQERVPRALTVFVTALAIFDDIGGILVIAFFYGHGIDGAWLGCAALACLIALALNRAYVVSGLAYALVGVGLWFTLHRAGIHATIAGVILGLMVPAKPRRGSREVLHELAEHVAELDRKAADEELEAAEILSIEQELEELQAPVRRFVHLLHPLVAFVIVPLFALANSGVAVAVGGPARIATPIVLGTAIGLFVGKQLGIFGFTLLAVRLGLAPMPGAASRTKLYGVSVIAGIGFTVALFIAGLAFAHESTLLDEAKLGILVGSTLAGLVGFVILRLTPRVSETH
ncbi:MAG TPA: Na+/H+ antiporter NhaA [Polyangiaceae bacterium]|jgi:NhaA family Na+:H+ antiporter|nr:Na+/H+ antiporter NhaA [Polyangiaceae bacterium]